MINILWNSWMGGNWVHITANRSETFVIKKLFSNNLNGIFFLKATERWIRSVQLYQRIISLYSAGIFRALECRQPIGESSPCDYSHLLFHPQTFATITTTALAGGFCSGDPRPRTARAAILFLRLATRWDSPPRHLLGCFVWCLGSFHG